MQIMSNRIVPGRQFTRKLAAVIRTLSLATPIMVSILNTPTIRAQSTPALPKFEVASIKLCKSGNEESGGGKKATGVAGGRIRFTPQTLTEECQSLDNLIRDAYLAYAEGKPWLPALSHQAPADASGDTCTSCGRVAPYSGRTLYREIQGSPGWANSVRHTIDAKAEQPATPEMMRGPMMQSLLEERFHLKMGAGDKRHACLRVDGHGGRGEASALTRWKLHSFYRNNKAVERRAGEI